MLGSPRQGRIGVGFRVLASSPSYPGRLALRFARVKGYRTDKPASEADTFAAIQDVYRQTMGQDPPLR